MPRISLEEFTESFDKRLGEYIAKRTYDESIRYLCIFYDACRLIRNSARFISPSPEASKRHGLIWCDWSEFHGSFADPVRDTLLELNAIIENSLRDYRTRFLALSRKLPPALANELASLSDNVIVDLENLVSIISECHAEVTIRDAVDFCDDDSYHETGDWLWQLQDERLGKAFNKLESALYEACDVFPARDSSKPSRAANRGSVEQDRMGERLRVYHAWILNNRNYSATARDLGKDPSSVRKMMKRLLSDPEMKAEIKRLIAGNVARGIGLSVDATTLPTDSRGNVDVIDGPR